MIYIKGKPIWIWLYATSVIIFNIYYYYPIYSGTWNYIDSLFFLSEWSIFVWFNIILSLIEIYAVTIGFYKGLNLARLYEIYYLIYSAFWANISIYFMRWQIFEHYIYFVLYVVLICWLLLSPVKEYFMNIPPNGTPIEKNKTYTYGDYTLYSKIVKLKSGKLQVIYFFSKKKPKSGTPINLPFGYKIYENKISKMPYLKKKRKISF